VALLARRAATVAEVAQRVFLSERQLERRFADHVGYGPKTLQRILRLQHVVRQLESHAAGRLAEVAASAGYADQSHLSRETRRLTGLTASARPLDRMTPRGAEPRRKRNIIRPRPSRRNRVRTWS
jgi:AraC-like DNA-binding protein